jgi:hypothetical protein
VKYYGDHDRAPVFVPQRFRPASRRIN